MKKVFAVIVGYTLLILAVCLALSAFVLKGVPELLPGVEKTFVLRRGLLCFAEALPALVFCSFMVGWAIEFGATAGENGHALHSEIFSHFGRVMASSIFLVLVLSLAREVAVPVLSFQQRRDEELPQIFKEYKSVAESSFAQGDMELACEYAMKALEIHHNDGRMLFVYDHSAAALDAMKFASDDEGADAVRPPADGDEAGQETVPTLLQKSQEAAEKEKWFESHYYAMLAVELCDETDLNRAQAQLLAADAWNNLQEPLVSDMDENEEQRLYRQKKAAYFLLTNGDDLGAYYKFLEILDNFEQAQFDPDVVQFMKIATDRVLRQNFFIDEVANLRKFETITDVCFSVPVTDGAKEVVFIKGITPIRDGGNMVQYLRGFSIYTFDKNGAFQQSVFAPYAKMLVEPVSTFDAATKRKFGISDALVNVPLIMLNGVDRMDKTKMSPPVFSSAEPKAQLDSRLILPISADDFTLACDASTGADNLSLLSLAAVVKNARHFGYSAEIFGSTLVTRLNYPILLLIIFVILATAAWNYRLERGQMFRFMWVFLMPFATLFLYFAYKSLLYFLKILNFVLFSSFGFYAIAGSLLLCVLAFAAASAMFLRRRPD